MISRSVSPPSTKELHGISLLSRVAVGGLEAGVCVCECNAF